MDRKETRESGQISEDEKSLVGPRNRRLKKNVENVKIEEFQIHKYQITNY
jgi:hypothetical protein